MQEEAVPAQCHQVLNLRTDDLFEPAPRCKNARQVSALKMKWRANVAKRD